VAARTRHGFLLRSYETLRGARRLLTPGNKPLDGGAIFSDDMAAIAMID
jgi:hypothetical protein